VLVDSAREYFWGMAPPHLPRVCGESTLEYEEIEDRGDGMLSEEK